MAGDPNKFTWGKDDLKVTVSQCADCENNDGNNDCKVYGIKPDVFALNKRKCPYFEKE